MTPQHITNAVVISVPAVSLALSLPEKVTVVAGILASIYYLMLMFDWCVKKYKAWKVPC